MTARRPRGKPVVLAQPPVVRPGDTFLLRVDGERIELTVVEFVAEDYARCEIVRLDAPDLSTLHASVGVEEIRRLVAANAA